MVKDATLMQKPKGTSYKRICVLCRKNNVFSCDGLQPCSRCVGLGRSSDCIYAVRKKKALLKSSLRKSRPVLPDGYKHEPPSYIFTPDVTCPSLSSSVPPLPLDSLLSEINHSALMSLEEADSKLSDVSYMEEALHPLCLLAAGMVVQEIIMEEIFSTRSAAMHVRCPNIHHQPMTVIDRERQQMRRESERRLREIRRERSECFLQEESVQWSSDNEESVPNTSSISPEVKVEQQHENRGDVRCKDIHNKGNESDTASFSDDTS